MGDVLTALGLIVGTLVAVFAFYSIVCWWFDGDPWHWL